MATLPPYPVTECLWALSSAFQARLAHELAAVGLSAADFRLVGEVMRAPEGLRQSDLATRLGVRAATVSAAVTRLERDGVLARARDRSDPRARIVRVAPSAPLERGFAVLRELEARALSSFTAAERKRLPRLLHQLIASLAVEE